MTFLTIISIKPEDREKIEEICNGIAEKDESFRYWFEEKRYGTFLVIASENKNRAMKRGLLLCKKYFPKEGIENVYFSVKER